MRKWVVIGTVIVALLGLAVVGREVWQRVDQRQQCEQLAEDAAARSAVEPGEGPRLAVMGDSYAAGYLLEDPESAWPSALTEEYRVRVDAFDGTGFTDEVLCPGHSFATRAPAVTGWDPGVIVVQGGLNDSASEATTIADGMSAFADEVPAGVKVVLVGPPMVPELDADGIRRTDETYAEQAEVHGWQYVSALGWDLDIADDGIHLTPEGHAEFGRQVLTALP